MFSTLRKSVAYRELFHNERPERPVQSARWEGGPDGLDMVPSPHPTPPLFVYWKFGPCDSYIIKAALGSILLEKELRQEHDVDAERDGYSTKCSPFIGPGLQPTGIRSLRLGWSSHFM